MKNPYEIEQQKIESLLQENKPKEVFEFIISLLKGENKDDINLKLRWSDLGGHKSNLILCHEETRTSIKSCKCEPVAAQV
ncbi:MAG: hypothetical protein JNN12_11220 [Bacteroidetes Order II. Incertae sedis bacterium]|nr:hypothetical protein [Bacteroidetes Order II. bacterium]